MGGSFDAAGSKSDSSSQGRQSTLNPVLGILGQALGLRTGVGQGGGIQYAQQEMPFPTGTINPNVFRSLGNLFQPFDFNIISPSFANVAQPTQTIGQAAPQPAATPSWQRRWSDRPGGGNLSGRFARTQGWARGDDTAWQPTTPTTATTDTLPMWEQPDTSMLQAFGNRGLADALSGMNMFSNTIMPSVGELASTGFKTDLAPVISEAQRLFQQEFLPQAAEQYGLMGLDAGDTDFGAAVAREAGNISSRLGAMDVDLSEAAAMRRLQGLPLASEVAQGASAFAPGQAMNLLGFEEQVRNALFGASPQGQLYNRLAMISGLPMSSAVTNTARGETDSWSTGASGGKGGGA